MHLLCELQKPSAIHVCCRIRVVASVGLDTDRMLPDMLPVSELINMWQQIREATNLRGLPQDISSCAGLIRWSPLKLRPFALVAPFSSAAGVTMAWGCACSSETGSMKSYEIPKVAKITCLETPRFGNRY